METPMKRCVACHSEIFPEAIKCTHCDTYQDWRRYVSASSTVLSLLIALLSVAGIVVPKLVETFDTPKSVFKIVQTKDVGVNLHVTLANGGDARGYLTGISVVADESFSISSNEDAVQLEAGDLLSKRVQLTQSQVENLGRFSHCELQVSVLGNDLVEQVLTHPIPCKR
jgi:hypothetical protein